MPRYALGTDSYLVYGDEGTPYTVAAAIDKQFGLITEDINPPAPNPHTPLPTAGASRGPHVYAEEHQEFAFPISFHVQNDEAPFHAALGAKASQTINAAQGDEYVEHLFTEADTLPTISVEHGQQTLGLIQTFIGTKADLGLTCSRNESLQANMPVVAATETHNEAAAMFPNAPTVPTTEPFRFSHINRVELLQEGTQTVEKTVNTLDSFDFNWQNGLTAVPHGGSGRQAYSVVEEENANRYDDRITVTAEDTDYFKRAADDEALVDLEIEFARQAVGGVTIDGVILRLFSCKVLEAPVPMPGTGRIMQEIPLGPTSTEIEVRTPP